MGHWLPSGKKYLLVQNWDKDWKGNVKDPGFGFVYGAKFMQDAVRWVLRSGMPW